MAALTGRTLIEMGYESVSNVGGFSSWKDGGGPIEE
jgi:rhodanese-related sulfurtransferase